MMTEEQKNQLFNHNMEELNKLNVAAGSMIKALLIGIESNCSTYIRLSNAQQSGNKVDYVYMEGDETMVDKIGRALGLVVSVTSLEVKHA